MSAVSTFRTVYVQAYTLSCVIEDICPGLDGMECAINGIFGKDSDEAHIVDGFQRVYETLDSVVSDEGNVDVQKFLGSKSDLALGDRMKALLGLVDGKLGWVERIGIEKSAWVAKAKAE
ncbi:MAG: hypothetical protein HDQ88_11790 [Clostridia bacterium]|nr:hypothetical protein [Clostridia bacterium]